MHDNKRYLVKKKCSTLQHTVYRASFWLTKIGRNRGLFYRCTISVSHSIAVKLSNCSTISPGNIDAHFFYSLTGLSFSRNTVAALYYPSSGKLCFNLMNDGSSWDCEQARWTQDPQRPALYIFDNYNKYYDSI